jgi:hypothetical protein
VRYPADHVSQWTRLTDVKIVPTFIAAFPKCHPGVGSSHLIYKCPRRNVPDFGRVFLVVKHTDITQNTYVQSWTVTEIMAREKCGLLSGQHYQLTSLNQCLSLCEVWCYVSASYSWVMYSIWNPNDKNDIRAGFTLG